MSIKIDKNVPIPTHRMGTHHKYPFNEMEVGDSFQVSAREKEGARVGAKYWGDRHQKKFVLRQQPDGTSRVWRIA